MTKPSATPSERFKRARDHCQSIVALIAPTEKTRRHDDVAVMIGADLWKRIYLLARKGARS